MGCDPMIKGAMRKADEYGANCQHAIHSKSMACNLFLKIFIVQAGDCVCKDMPIKFNKRKSIFNKI